MAEAQIEIPREWEQIKVEKMRGTLMVVGAPDTGKTTLARYLYRRLSASAQTVAYLDGDPGQSTLGPPTTLTLGLGKSGDDAFPPRGPTWRSFVGSVSPTGHMLPALTGAARLVEAARGARAEAIVYDTSGLVSPSQGGNALKLNEIDLLHPSVLFALQREQELESWLASLRHSRRLRVVDLRSSPVAQRRLPPARQAHRAEQYAQYLRSAHPLTLEWENLAVFPSPRFAYHQLVALEDVDGFTLGLGVVMEADLKARHVTLYTPLRSPDGIDALRLGDVLLDLQTFRDQVLTRSVKRER